MKKITMMFLLIFAIMKTYAQDYLISFTGSGASTTVDSVKVENLTQGSNLSMPGIDTLHLTGNIGINEIEINNETIKVYPNPMTLLNILECKKEFAFS